MCKPIRQALQIHGAAAVFRCFGTDLKVLQEIKDYGMINRSISHPGNTHINGRYAIKGDGSFAYTG